MNSIPSDRLCVDSKDSTLLSGKFPSHAFFKNYLIHTWLDGLELKDALPILHRVITRDAEEFIAEESKPIRVIRGHPLFASRPILPQVDDERLINCDVTAIRDIRS
jgi:hypothetical protein